MSGILDNNRHSVTDMLCPEIKHIRFCGGIFKRSFLCITLIIPFLSGCLRSYSYVEESIKEVSPVKPTYPNLSKWRLYTPLPKVVYPNYDQTTITIKAFSNYGAKRKASKLFLERRHYAVDAAEIIALGKSNKKEIDPIPFSYDLLDLAKSDKKIIKGATEFDNPFKIGSYFWQDDNNNAFGGVSFGMTPSEVARIEQFKDFMWNESDDSYDGADSLGLCFYSIRLFFEEEKLYKIEFSSSPYYERDISAFIEDVRNLRNIFWRAFGKPYSYNTIPSDWYSHLIYTWDTTQKEVSIRCQDFCSIATITYKEWIKKQNDDKRQEIVNNENKKESVIASQERLINEAAKKFQ